ncbi:hypothetical protein [Hydrogenophaga sp. SL48]|uniref:hypothetical protein n=1 Tax=Hydrogenophaga sp. SL48 TaxID=2806347 RepID=UPI001F15FFEC|nr:hypothetical protein [Hydrogenophaga sp. SL48]UJW79794.1 gamma-glutamylcyclotransferase [Hydrogenophaga sp. SL48]
MPKKKTPCTIPETPSIEAMKHVAFQEPDHERDEIAEYVEWQSNRSAGSKVEVTYLERIKSEIVFGTEHVAWDVHTDEPARWWVITGPTNLYSQGLFPSLDYTFSLHVGLMARVASRDAKRAPSRDAQRLRAAWRRWETAMEAIDAANEAEDFQAVGMRCRETLVALVKSLQKSIDIPEDQQRPQASNVVDWFDLIALNYAAGARNERVRSYLRSTAKETWQLLNWLTHTSSAGLQDAQIALDATSHLLTMTTRVVSRKEAAPPLACPTCGSYRIAAVFDPDIPRDPSYVSLCQSCGWNDLEQDAEEQN